MAKLLGTVEDLEDYKQKIQKQQKLKRKTINSVKKLLTNDEIKLIEARSNQEDLEKPRRIKNTMALLNQLIKYFQHLGVIDRSCVYQVKKVQDKNHFGIENLIFEGF